VSQPSSVFRAHPAHAKQWLVTPDVGLHVRMNPKYLRKSGTPKWEEGATSEIARVMLPSGDLIWVRVQAAEPAATDGQAAGAADVGLAQRIAPTAEVLNLPGFAETVRGVVTSVRQALDEHRPDSLAVEFGIEIAARAGGLLSVLAEVGASAQIRVTASWDRHDAAMPPFHPNESGSK
jgi:Trypsin-co-occurring domain 1